MLKSYKKKPESPEKKHGQLAQNKQTETDLAISHWSVVMNQLSSVQMFTNRKHHAGTFPHSNIFI